MKKLLFLGIIWIGNLWYATAQNNAYTTDNQSLTWAVVQWTHELAAHDRLIYDFNTRHFLPEFQHQLMGFRLKYQRLLTKNWDVQPGFAVFLSDRGKPVATKLRVPEIRPSLEFNHQQHLLSQIQVLQRYFLEARFFRKTNDGKLVDGYQFNWRFRYRLGADIDFLSLKIREKPIKIRIFDEIHLNAGWQIGANFFDQNRVYLGSVLPIFGWLSLDAGWMRVFQSSNKREIFVLRNHLRITLVFTSKS